MAKATTSKAADTTSADTPPAAADKPAGKIKMKARAVSPTGFRRGGVYWPHVPNGEEIPVQEVDADKVEMILAETHLRDAEVVEG